MPQGHKVYLNLVISQEMLQQRNKEKTKIKIMVYLLIYKKEATTKFVKTKNKTQSFPNKITVTKLLLQRNIENKNVIIFNLNFMFQLKLNKPEDHQENSRFRSKYNQKN